MTPAAGLPRAILDSSVIFSRVLHELFGRLALEGRLFDLVWSDELLAEAKRVLIERKPVDETVAARWVGYLAEAFPDGRVPIRQLGSDLDLSVFTDDPDDEHVCALAIAAAPATLVTFDDDFNTGALARHHVTVTRPDQILVPTAMSNPTSSSRSLNARPQPGAAERSSTSSTRSHAPAPQHSPADSEPSSSRPANGIRDRLDRAQRRCG